MEEKLDLRIQKTYLALTSNFLKMLEEMPFEQVTVNELCSRAMVRRPPFISILQTSTNFLPLW